MVIASETIFKTRAHTHTMAGVGIFDFGGVGRTE
jgi:hypothetical protein